MKQLGMVGQHKIHIIEMGFNCAEWNEMVQDRIES